MLVRKHDTIILLVHATITIVVEIMWIIWVRGIIHTNLQGSVCWRPKFHSSQWHLIDTDNWKKRATWQNESSISADLTIAKTKSFSGTKLSMLKKVGGLCAVTLVRSKYFRFCTVPRLFQTNAFTSTPWFRTIHMYWGKDPSLLNRGSEVYNGHYDTKNHQKINGQRQHWVPHHSKRRAQKIHEE